MGQFLRPKGSTDRVNFTTGCVRASAEIGRESTSLSRLAKIYKIYFKSLLCPECSAQVSLNGGGGGGDAYSGCGRILFRVYDAIYTVCSETEVSVAPPTPCGLKARPTHSLLYPEQLFTNAVGFECRW